MHAYTQFLRRGRGTKQWAALALIALVSVVTGCAADGPSTSSPIGTTSASATGYPVSIENCGRTLTFDAAPERVVSLWQAPTEMMLALGLGDRLVARAGDYASYPLSLMEEVEEIPSIGSGMGWPSKEVLLSQGTDLVLGQSLEGYAFDTSQGYASVDQVEDSGAQVYGANLCDADGGDAVAMTLETPLDTVRDLAAIFGVNDRAEEVIAELENDRQAVIDAVDGLDRVDVAFYNGGEGPLIVLAGGIYDDAIETAGGRNVFPADSVYVSKESFAASDADAILVGTFEGQDFETLRAYLEQTFPDLPAVQAGNLIEIPVADTDASVSVMRGLTEIANALHPELDLTVPKS